MVRANFIIQLSHFCSNGVVWGLQLENLRLMGQIDVDALVPLRSLRTISLMNNSFEGPMPEWKKLGTLKSLFLFKTISLD